MQGAPIIPESMLSQIHWAAMIWSPNLFELCIWKKASQLPLGLSCACALAAISLPEGTQAFMCTCAAAKTGTCWADEISIVSWFLLIQKYVTEVQSFGVAAFCSDE